MISREPENLKFEEGEILHFAILHEIPNCWILQELQLSILAFSIPFFPSLMTSHPTARFLSKVYGFVTFKNVESFLLALENPSNKIDGFVSNKIGGECANQLRWVLRLCWIILRGMVKLKKGLGVWYGDREIKESAKAALTEKVKFVDGFRLVCKMVSREREKSNRNPKGVLPVKPWINECFPILPLKLCPRERGVLFLVGEISKYEH